MEAKFCFLLVLIGSFAALHLAHAQDQSGFISLDCGLVPKEKTYAEKTTNITYRSDANFIDTGESKKIQSQYETLFQQQSWFLRSFPQGKRNCYNLNVTKSKKYLIRATFVHGNYDDLNKLPKFDLYIGPNKWISVEIPGVANATIKELIHVPTSDRLQVCLVKTGSTIPFISSLELRPLKNDTYVTQTGSLSTYVRVFLTPGQRFLRFDEDVHDRIWIPYFQKEWTQISTTSTIGMDGSYDPPQLALQTAATPANASEPMIISWKLVGNPTSYVYMHFAEIEMLKENETRVFNITYNGGQMWYPNFRLFNFRVNTIFNPKAVRSSDGNYDFMFTKTESSTHPPLLNAIEIYRVVELPDPETDQNDSDAVMSIKETYGLARISWQGDPCSPQEYLWEGLNCSYKNWESPRIISLNLSSSRLTGHIAHQIQDMTELEVLDLSNNSLTGELPEFLSEMKSLKSINLSGNNLNGSVPAALAPKIKDGSLIIEGNNIICSSDLCEHKKKAFIIPVVASVASLGFVSAALAVFFIFRRKRKSTEALPPSKDEGNVDRNSNIPSEPLIVSKDRRLTYADILRMTNNFQRSLGKGGFGTVYHGYLNDKEEVAVKLLSHSSAQGYKQFKAEVELLLRVHHRNLVSLVGYCDDGNHLALVYEYMENGDLREHLSGKRGSPLDWAARLRVAAEAAQGLEYLHNGSRPPIVHRDVKTTNILLNEHLQCKLADFGLSRSFPIEGETHISTVVAGTPGYLDPEYYRTNWLSEKSDVYSFGIVLLEIITNQPVIDKNRERPHITECVGTMLTRGDIRDIVDPTLQGNYNRNTAWKTLELAMTCVNPSSSKRPTMTHVVVELNECLASESSSAQGSFEMESKSSLDVSISFGTEYNPGAR